MRNIKKEGLQTSFIFNLIYEIIVVISPLIITPKLSRVFGVDYVGIKSFTYSIMYYFSIVALLGLDMLGQRKVALEKDNPEKRSEIFCTIFSIRFFLFFIVIALYFIFILLFNGSEFEKIVFACWGIYLFRGMINPVWFLQGIGKYKLLSILNIISISTYIILTFVFINQKNQLPLYIVIYTGIPLLISISCFPIVFRYIKLVYPNFKETFKILKESFVYFIPTIAIAIYSMIDKTMLGLFDPTQVSTGLYESTDKLIKVAIAVCTASYTIVRTRMSYLFSMNDKKVYEKSYKNIISFSMMLCWPVMFGLLAIASDFVPIFFGTEFIDVVNLTYVFSLAIPFLTISGLIQSIYIFPFGFQKQMNIYYIIVLSTNILMNVILINLFGTIGAIIASVLSEALLAILLIIKAKGDIKTSFIFSSSVKYFLSAFVMFFFIVLFSKMSNLPSVYKVSIEIIAGIIIYFTVCFLLQDSFVLSQTKRMLGRVFKINNKTII